MITMMLEVNSHTTHGVNLCEKKCGINSQSMSDLKGIKSKQIIVVKKM
jgi:hypothetical protein